MVQNIETGTGGIQNLLAVMIQLNRDKKEADLARLEREEVRELARGERDFKRMQFEAQNKREQERFDWDKLQAQIGSLTDQRDAELKRKEPNMDLVNSLNARINELQGIEFEAKKRDAKAPERGIKGIIPDIKDAFDKGGIVGAGARYLGRGGESVMRAFGGGERYDRLNDYFARKEALAASDMTQLPSDEAIAMDNGLKGGARFASAEDEERFMRENPSVIAQALRTSSKKN